MPILEAIFTVTNLTTFLSKIYDAWRFLKENRERQLDRDQQRYLQEEQHTYELALMNARSAVKPHNTLISVTLEKTVDLDTEHFLLLRLQEDAQKLTEVGFDIIYECLDNGYGLALPIDNDLVFGFLIPSNYPTEAPTVLVRQGIFLEEIPFGPDSWHSTFMLIDIVEQLVPAFTNIDMDIEEAEAPFVQDNPSAQNTLPI